MEKAGKQGGQHMQFGNSRTSQRFRTALWFIAAGWTVILALTLILSLRHIDNGTVETARSHALAAFEKDVLYRRWVASLGGVYAPQTDTTPSNPYLEVPERDISTPSGMKLTLINPAYMTRLVHELGRKESGIKGHITSLNPIRPENRADEWEARALKQLAKGPAKVVELQDINGGVHLRYMGPLVTEKGCLKCHRNQGYSVGTVRGGISISVPMEPLWAIVRPQKTITAVGIGLVWIIGMAAVCLGGRMISVRIKESEAAHRELEKKNDALAYAKAESELLAHQAVAASKAKSQFLANMSHEIRTPMNGVIGMAGLLLETDLKTDQREYAEVVRNSGEVLIGIINDVLDFSKIEAGKLDLEQVEFNMRVMLEEANDLLAVKAHQKGLEYIYSIDPDVPFWLKGDPGRIRQILTNLVGNAVKFTGSGEVAVNVGLAHLDASQVSIRFSVSDTGIGIPRERQEILFEAFEQADTSTTRRYGGTGLGLTISKKLVEMMGGTIGMENNGNAGSTFWFTVQLEQVQPADLSCHLEGVDLSDARILIVDDHPVNRRFLSILLDQWGGRYSEAESGETALAALTKAAEEGDPFSIALLDMQMFPMSGVVLGRKIKEDPSIEATHLVMLTSFARRGDARQMESIGFSGYLTKPIKSEQLRQCLLMILNMSRDPRGDNRPPLITRHTVAEHSRHPWRILLAEDNIINQKVALNILSKLGYLADAVADGNEVIDALHRIDYDLVIMDCHMPVMDGFEATRAIRSSKTVHNPNVPVVALTADVVKGIRRRCRDAGMNDCMSKPVNPEDLDNLLKTYLPADRRLDAIPPN